MQAMSPLNALIFGLGLFFLGLRLVGENLKGLCSGGLQTAIARTTRKPVAGGALGFVAGALMQSATAVTFICVSMLAAGLLTPSAAAGVVVWSNVGLTVLAFVATLDIHPAVAFVVGGAGIVMGVVRVRTWQTVASVLLGIGLILLGLQQMSEGAAPLKDDAWFRAGIHVAVSSPPLAFLAGVLTAAILQSNTGATMMVITLAGAGAIDFQSAALLIYGTNLGAIALRLLLAAGMSGGGLRLVRLEDLFCAWAGLLMMVLFCIEQAGVPLVFALSGALACGIDARLAVVFFLSNFLPAVAFVPFLSRWQGLLERAFPDRPGKDDGSPVYISERALDDPPSALVLLRRELARLLESAGTEPPGDSEFEPPPRFQKLSLAVEHFCAELASRSNLNSADAVALHRLRGLLSAIRHAEDGIRSFRQRLRKDPDAMRPDAAAALESAITSTVDACAKAIAAGDLAALGSLREHTRSASPEMEALREKAFPDRDQSASIAGSAAFEDFKIAAWSIHRIAKLASSFDRPAPR